MPHFYSFFGRVKLFLAPIVTVGYGAWAGYERSSAVPDEIESWPAKPRVKFRQIWVFTAKFLKIKVFRQKSGKSVSKMHFFQRIIALLAVPPHFSPPSGDWIPPVLSYLAVNSAIWHRCSQGVKVLISVHVYSSNIVWCTITFLITLINITEQPRD